MIKSDSQGHMPLGVFFCGNKTIKKAFLFPFFHRNGNKKRKISVLFPLLLFLQEIARVHGRMISAPTDSGIHKELTYSKTVNQ